MIYLILSLVCIILAVYLVDAPAEIPINDAPAEIPINDAPAEIPIKRPDIKHPNNKNSKEEQEMNYTPDNGSRGFKRVCERCGEQFSYMAAPHKVPPKKCKKCQYDDIEEVIEKANKIQK